MIKKELYAAPETEVLELHIENAILDVSTQTNRMPVWGEGGDLDDIASGS